MPRELCGPDRPSGAYKHSLTNLIWRGQVENRKDDEQAIDMVFNEAHTRRFPAEKRRWADEWIRRFLVTKRDEALACPADLVDLSSLKDMSAKDEGTNWLHWNAGNRKTDHWHKPLFRQGNNDQNFIYCREGSLTAK